MGRARARQRRGLEEPLLRHGSTREASDHVDAGDQARSIVPPCTGGHGHWDSCWFSWVTPLMQTGSRRQLQAEDLLRLDPSLQPEACGRVLWLNWSKELLVRPERPSLLWVLARTYAKPYAWLGVLKLLNDLLSFSGPLLLKLLVTWLTSAHPHQSSTPASPDLPAPQATVAADPHLTASAPAATTHTTLWPEGGSAGSGFGRMAQAWTGAAAVALDPSSPGFGWICVAMLGLSSVVRALLNAHYNFQLSRLCCQLRAGLMCVLYRKSLLAVRYDNEAAPTPTPAQPSPPQPRGGGGAGRPRDSSERARERDHNSASNDPSTGARGDIHVGDKANDVLGDVGGAARDGVRDVADGKSEVAACVSGNGNGDGADASNAAGSGVNSASTGNNGSGSPGGGGGGSEDVATLMSVDAGRAVNLLQSFHELWSLPWQMGLALYLLYTQVRYAFLAGLAVSLLLVPANRVIASRILTASAGMMAAKDARISAMSELLRGIRAVKTEPAWEAFYRAKIAAARHLELRGLAVRKYLDALCVYFWAATSLLFSALTFGLVVLMGGGAALTPAVAFTSLSLFQLLTGPLNAFPWVLNGVVEAVVSVRRLQSYLSRSETKALWAYEDLELGLGDLPPRSAAAVLAATSASPSGEVSVSPLPSARRHRRGVLAALEEARAAASLLSGPATGGPGGAGGGGGGNGSGGEAGPLERLLTGLRLPPAAAAALTWRNRVRAARGKRIAGGGAGASAGGRAVLPSTNEAGSALRAPIAAQQQQQLPEAQVAAASFCGATLSWGQDARPCLSHITLSIPRGALTVVVGRVGSGKSSLLAALLGSGAVSGGGGGGGGELPLLAGTCRTFVRRWSYAPQQPWVTAGTVRDNVLLGLPLRAGLYRRVLHNCALLPDLAAMPRGDLSPVGDHGCNLSGGQRARLGLARALYHAACAATGTGTTAVPAATSAAPPAATTTSTASSPSLHSSRHPDLDLDAHAVTPASSLQALSLPQDLTQDQHVYDDGDDPAADADWFRSPSTGCPPPDPDPEMLVLLDDVLASLDRVSAAHVVRHALLGPLLVPHGVAGGGDDGGVSGNGDDGGRTASGVAATNAGASKANSTTLTTLDVSPPGHPESSGVGASPLASLTGAGGLREPRDGAGSGVVDDGGGGGGGASSMGMGMGGSSGQGRQGANTRSAGSSPRPRPSPSPGNGGGGGGGGPTVVLASNDLRCIRAARLVVVLEAGRVVYAGGPQGYLASEHCLHHHHHHHHHLHSGGHLDEHQQRQEQQEQGGEGQGEEDVDAGEGGAQGSGGRPGLPLQPALWAEAGALTERGPDDAVPEGAGSGPGPFVRSKSGSGSSSSSDDRGNGGRGGTAGSDDDGLAGVAAARAAAEAAAAAAAKTAKAPPAEAAPQKEAGGGQEEEEEEQREVGHVRWRVYGRYMAAVGRGVVVAVLLSLLLMQVSRNASDLWVSFYAAQSGSGTSTGAATDLAAVTGPATATAAVSGGGGGLAAAAAAGAAVAVPHAPSPVRMPSAGAAVAAADAAEGTRGCSLPAGGRAGASASTGTGAGDGPGCRPGLSDGASMPRALLLRPLDAPRNGTGTSTDCGPETQPSLPGWDAAKGASASGPFMPLTSSLPAAWHWCSVLGGVLQPHPGAAVTGPAGVQGWLSPAVALCPEAAAAATTGASGPVATASRPAAARPHPAAPAWEGAPEEAAAAGHRTSMAHGRITSHRRALLSSHPQPQSQPKPGTEPRSLSQLESEALEGAAEGAHGPGVPREGPAGYRYDGGRGPTEHTGGGYRGLGKAAHPDLDSRDDAKAEEEEDMGPASGLTGGDVPCRGLGKAADPSLQPDLDLSLDLVWSPRVFLTGVVVIAAANSVFTMARAFSFALAGMRAAALLHEQLLAAVLAAPMAFFESVPHGRILNRFSSDLTTVDDSLPFILNIALANAASLLGLLGVLCYAAPPLLPLLLPLAFLYRRIQLYYRSSSREIRRLEALALSPVYGAFGGLAETAPLVRAFASQRHFLGRAVAAVSRHQRAAITGGAASAWLGLRLQLLASVLVAAVAGLAVWRGGGGAAGGGTGARGASAIDGGNGCGDASNGGNGGNGSSSPAGGDLVASLAGLSLAYALPVVGLLNGLLTSSAETEQEMVAVERVGQYVDGLQPQPVTTLPGPLTATLPGSPVPPPGSPVPPPVLRMDAPTAAADGPLPQWNLSAAAAGAATATPAAEAGTSMVVVVARATADGSADSATETLQAPAATTTQQPAEAEGQEQQQHGQQPDVVLLLDRVLVRYRPGLPPALDGPSLAVTAGEHVGLVGRSGAGKSSVVATVLRLVEVEAGRVILYGNDVRAVPLPLLRSSVGVLPQHPFVASASVRENLNPGRRTGTAGHPSAASGGDALPDAALCGALRRVGLWAALAAAAVHRRRRCLPATAGDTAPGEDAPRSVPSTTQHDVVTTRRDTTADAEAATPSPTPTSTSRASAAKHHHRARTLASSASSASVSDCEVLDLPLGSLPGAVGLSAGQQQLLCLARLLLRPRRLVLLDECSAHVDPATAATIRRLVSEELLGRGDGRGEELTTPAQRWSLLPGSGVGADGVAARAAIAPELQRGEGGGDGVRNGRRGLWVPSGGGAGGCAVLEVAHDLAAVGGCDRVVVLEAGRVMEEGRPAELLQLPGGRFRALSQAAAAAATAAHGGTSAGY